MKLKGIGLAGTYHWISMQFDSEAIEKVKAALTDTDRLELFSKPILQVSWYDYNAYFRWITAVDKILGKGDFKLMQEAAKGSARDTFKGIYKFFISLTNPHFILDNAPRVWRHLFNEGDVAVEWLAPKHVVIKLSGVSNLPLHHELDQAPSLEEVTRLSGAKNLRSQHSKCLARGDDACWFEMLWD